MEDMKRLIEKYKQELMEYSKAAAPKESLAFPEMIEENEPVRAMDKADERGRSPAVTESAAPVREAPAPAAEGSEEKLNCQGEPIPGTVYTPPQPIEQPQERPSGQPAEEPEPCDEPACDGCDVRDYEELTPVTFDGGRMAPPAEETREAPVQPESKREPTEAQEAEECPTEQPKPARKPEIIGYVNDGSFDYDSIFGDMLSEPRVSDRRVTSEAPRYDELPSQRETSDANTAESVRRGGDPEFSGEVSGVTDNSPREPRPEFAQSGSVTPEQAQQLTERPINSRPTEQLTGRSFEDDGNPVNSRSDIRPLHDGTAPADRPNGSPAYSNLQDFEPCDEYEGSGSGQQSNNFRFQVYTARDALPIKGAVCIIKRKNNGGYVTMFEQVTDLSGQTTPVSLPAPPASLSQSPGNTVQPYALYDAEVSAKGYNTVEIRNIPVFEGVLSVQRVAMIPRTEENVTEIIDEQETDLNGGK